MIMIRVVCAVLTSIVAVAGTSLAQVDLGGGGAASSADEIIDADGDTIIQVEESADDDTVRFDAGGVQDIVIVQDDSGSGYLAVVGGIATSDAIVTSVTIEAADAQAAAVTNQDGADIILEPGANATGGGTDGLVIVRQADGVAGTDEITLWHDGTNGLIDSVSGDVHVEGTWLVSTSRMGTISLTGGGSILAESCNRTNPILIPRSQAADTGISCGSNVDKDLTMVGGGATILEAIGNVTATDNYLRVIPSTASTNVTVEVAGTGTNESLDLGAQNEAFVTLSNDGTDSAMTIACDSTQVGDCFVVEADGGGDYLTVDPTSTDITGNLNVTGDLTMSAGFMDTSTTAGITASATQTQGQGALTTQLNQISTVATNGDVVTLTVAVAGRIQTILNDGANTVQIYPASGDDLGNGVDISTELESNEAVIFAAYDATNWDIEAETEIFHAEMEDSNNTDAFAITVANNVEVYHTNGLEAGDVAGWTFDIGGGGTTFPIASIADAGGGDVTITTTGTHTLAIGAIVSQANLTDANYEGVFQVLTVPTTTTYTVTATWGATDTGTMQEATTLTANPSAAGAYFFSWSVSATAASSNSVVDFQLRADAIMIGPPTRRLFKTASEFGSMSGSGIVDISANDKVTFDINNTSNAGDITIRNFALSLIRL
jgi:hypothetical protein